MVAHARPPPLTGPLVVDASTVVEYLVSAAHTVAATRVFRAVMEAQAELWAPDLVYPEATSVFRKLERGGHLAPSAARAAVDHLTRLPIGISGTGALMSDVWKLRSFLTPYDACYVALADRLDAVFVTAERSLVAELRKRRKRAFHLGEL
jgi:predicted nucleic acid-binding protein